MRYIHFNKNFVFIALTVLSAAAHQTAPALEPSSSEYEIKAAFIFNFAKFIDWPPQTPNRTGDFFVIGVIGVDPFDNSLEQTIGGKTIKGMNLQIKKFRRIEDLQACQILFISESEKFNLPVILERIRDKSVLTVSDMPDFARDGGMIHLYTEDNKVRFTIHIQAAEKAGLKISAKLLNLARILSD